MSDPSDDQTRQGAAGDAGSHEGSVDTQDSADGLDELRKQVDEKYDFENFSPADMAEMSAEEWEAAFDSDSWITGPELLDRLEKELKNKIASRDVFGVIERETVDGVDRILVYSDEGYVIVTPDGTVEGEGGVLRDVEPMVALCSMEEYEIPEPPESYQLPSPESVPEQTGELGNLMIQIIAGMQLLGGVGLIGAWLLTDVDTLVAPVIGGLFLGVGIFLFSLVANARLSDRFRAEQYRDRLRAVETHGFERPEGLDGSEQPTEIEDTDRSDISSTAATESTARDESQESRDRKTEGA